MAATLGDLLVYLRGDTKQLEESLDSAEKKTESAGGKIADVFGGALKVGIAAAGTAIVGIGAAAVSMASEVSQAQNDLQAEFGLTEERAQELNNVAKQVFGNNFADSFTDAAKAVGLVEQQLKGLARPEEFQTITENAFRLRDAFGVEVGEGISAAKTLMENFGVSSQEAFDMLARGYQVGLDRSGDFLDTIGEYAVQFADGGASAREFFSVLDTGLQGGMLGTDKAADLFKEFRVRIQDGSTLTRESLEAIGIDADAMAAKFADGSITAIEAFNQVDSALKRTTDENVRFQAGVGLLGTQFEDLGESAVFGIDTMSDNFANLEGSVDKIDAKYNNLGSALEGVRRTFLLAIEPLGAGLLGIINENLPAINSAIDTMVGGVVTSLTNLKTGWDEDWGGIRTTLTTFATDAPPILQDMWDEIVQMFDREGEITAAEWESFWGGMASSASSQTLHMLENTEGFLHDLRLLIQGGQAMIEGDQETHNAKILEFWGNQRDQILDFIENMWGPQIRLKVLLALMDVSNAVQEAGARIAEQWRNLFILPDWLGGGSLFPQSAPTPNLGVINPANIQGGNTTNINVNVGGGNDPFQTGTQIGDGIQHVMRMRGG